MSKNLAREFDEFDEDGEEDFLPVNTEPKVRKMRDRDDSPNKKKTKQRQLNRKDETL